MKFLFLPKHEYLGASSRYRTLQYLPFLINEHLQYDLEPLFNDEYLIYKYKNGRENVTITLKRIIRRIKIILFISKKYDLLIIEKEIIPYFPPILEWYLRFRNINYILDYDDAVWHNYDNHRIYFVRILLKNKIKSIVRNATAVIGGSEYIIKYVKNANATNVIKIPTVINTSIYNHDVSKCNNLNFVIGWIGSPSTSLYIVNINKILTIFTRKHNAVVKLIGFDQKLVHLLTFNYQILSWSEDTEVSNMATFDVGIMPLSDSHFEQGKCGFKLIQYMGCNLPVLASPVGENKYIVENGINGFLVNSQKEWLQKLEYLHKTPKIREVLGHNGRKKVEQFYSLQYSSKLYLKLIKQSAYH